MPVIHIRVNAQLEAPGYEFKAVNVLFQMEDLSLLQIYCLSSNSVNCELLAPDLLYSPLYLFLNHDEDESLKHRIFSKKLLLASYFEMEMKEKEKMKFHQLF